MSDYWIKQLEDDIEWREKELSLLKFQVLQASTKKDPRQYKILLRAISVMLYAHYEGFCKFAWDIYLEALARKGIKRKECKDNIVKLSLKSEFGQLRKDLSSDKIWDFAQTFHSTLLEKKLVFTQKLGTQSNLRPTLFISNINEVELNCTLANFYKNELDALVDNRNSIAHGENFKISNIAEYQKYEQIAIEVMYELAISIIDALEKKLYLKTPTP
ncbi:MULTISPECIES: MAE_28990/MAE_18760 family HEPN-like nuclease [Spirulina sp. CCY15215]|uniref:MAE_28990/MAE_18760 family HEPN-like nuclease n=1 Tax=Spirulina sp. CCY15215 TaxID=2767591 RepID=UPI00194E91F6|nr:MAE_28990/MAE_18760 family HEPN-like nuclease [Spirulina major]